MSQSQAHPGWIFSPVTDVAMFWLPVLIGYGTWLSTGGQVGESFSMGHLLIGILLFNSVHIVATLGPVYRRARENQMSWVRFYMGPVMALIGAVFVYHYSRTLFFSILAPYTLFHVVKQQYGWVMLSRRTFGEPLAGLNWDRVMIWNAMVGPSLWWLSPLSPIEKTYFKPGDFTFLIPEAVAQLGVVVYIVIFVAYMIHLSILTRSQAINWGKMSLLASTYVWFLALLLFPNRYVFFFTLIYVHALPYIFHSRRDFANAWSAGRSRIGASLTYLTAIFALGVFYSAGTSANDAFMLANPGQTRWFEILLWLPLVPHYYFDAIIWRRQKAA